MLRLVFLCVVLLTSTSWAAECRNIKIAQQKAQSWILENKHRASDFDLLYGEGAAAAIIDDRYSEFVSKSDCGSLTTKVTLKRYQMPERTLEQLCMQYMPLNLTIGNGETVYVPISTPVNGKVVLIFDNNHSCEIRKYY